jgi:hypothetical protein
VGAWRHGHAPVEYAMLVSCRDQQYGASVDHLACFCQLHEQPLMRLRPASSALPPPPLSRAGFAKVEKRVRTAGGGSTGSVRNLRIREDTAKYLLNLDTNSGGAWGWRCPFRWWFRVLLTVGPCCRHGHSTGVAVVAQVASVGWSASCLGAWAFKPIYPGALSPGMVLTSFLSLPTQLPHSLLRPQVSVDARGPQPRQGPLAEDVLWRQLCAAERRGGRLHRPQRVCRHHARARAGRAHAGKWRGAGVRVGLECWMCHSSLLEWIHPGDAVYGACVAE